MNRLIISLAVYNQKNTVFKTSLLITAKIFSHLIYIHSKININLQIVRLENNLGNLGEETERHPEIQRDSLSSMSPQEFVFINGNKITEG